MSPDIPCPNCNHNCRLVADAWVRCPWCGFHGPVSQCGGPRP